MPERAPYTSSALDAGSHDVSGFASGEQELDSWLRDHAYIASRARVARTFVWTTGNESRVVAYYTLSAHAVPRSLAPPRIGRGVPDPVPAALIAKLALHKSLRGKRLGDVLLVDALERIIAAGDEGPAVRAIVVDAATTAGRALYERFGFVPAPGHPSRMIVRAETIARGLSGNVGARRLRGAGGER